MRRIITLLLLVAAPVYAETRLDVAGSRVTIETDRYKVVVDGLTITNVDNKLTGEVYAAPLANAAPSPGLVQMLADRGVAVESLRPAVPVKRFGVCEKTKITSAKEGDGATVTFTGLQFGAGEQAEFAANMTITLRLKVEAGSGDLLITPEVKGNIEEVHGIRDRGVLRNSLHVLNLANGLKMIIPSGDGAALTSANALPEWSNSVLRWAWPMAWEAGLLIAEGDKGCMGIWADEAPLKYGRHLSMCRSGDRWNVGFEYETSDVIYRCDEINNATWRLNVYAGYWVKAAERYQQQVMIGQWHMKTLPERTPAWADKVRIILGSSTPPVSCAAELAKMFPPDSMVVFTSQGWLKGWGTKDSPEYGFPNFPPGNATRYEAAVGIDKIFHDLEELHVHVFPYTNATCVSPDIPWIRQKLNGHQMLAWKAWQRMYPELCQDVVKRYGVSGIYEDCSWNMTRSPDGAPDGDCWPQGSVHMREYFHEMMPDVAMMGERNNEVTARGQQFALGWVRDSANMHPICSYLFDPFVRMWNLGAIPFPNQTFDADDIRGYSITIVDPYLLKDPLQEIWMSLKRAEVFSREQLNSYWPPTWDPSVRHYFKGKDGTEYRFVSDRGSRFVKMRPDGSLETIYWRLHGVREADAPGVGIEGWLGYNGDKIIGLNPAVPQYVTAQGVTRPPAVISSVPDGYVIHRSVVRDGYWLATLEPTDTLKVAPSPELKEPKIERAVKTIRVRSAKPVQFVGVESVKPVAEGEYEVQVALPGGFGAYWSEPVTAPFGPVPAAVMTSSHDRLSGVVCHRYPNPNLGGGGAPVGEIPMQEGSTTWLIKLPPAPLHLAFGYGTEHGYGDGANYMVRVNGREVWKEYRPQTSTEPAEAAAHKAPPIPTAAVDLSAYAGQIVVLEVANNGNQSGGSETVAWPQLRFDK